MSTLVHIQISADRLIAENMATGARAESSTHVYVSDTDPVFRVAEPGDGAPVVLGPKALRAGRVVNGFGHPRTLVSDFHAAEYVVRQIVDSVWSSRMHRWLRRRIGAPSAPRILFQIRRDLGSPITDIEVRALYDIGLNLGAVDVFVENISRDLAPETIAQLARR